MEYNSFRIPEKFPSAKETTDTDEKERTFQRSTDSVIKVYRFFNDKIYWGRTVYEDPELETEEAIIEKIIEIYGKFDDSNEWTQDNKGIFRYGVIFLQHFQ